MSRTNLSKLKIQVVRCMQLIDKYDYRIAKMENQRELVRSTLMALHAQIEAKEAIQNALSPN